VEALADAHAWVIPSYGLHPWHAAGRSARWLDSLTRHLDRETARGRKHGVGEIGLDRWKKPFDFADQQEVFVAQLALAAGRNLPVMIHCLEAWGAMDALLHSQPLPTRGFLLHAYGGPAELVPRFAALGAYFSFNGYFLHDRKESRRDVFRRVPPDRLLVETDAPAMPAPASITRHQLPAAPDGTALNHPASLADVYPALAALRGLEPTALEALVEQNFLRLFGP
jgi:TatD DNase family protein